MSADAINEGASLEKSGVSIWRLTRRSSNVLLLAMLGGTLFSIPAVYHAVTQRFKSYTELVYLVGDSPHNEAQLTQWANSKPGIERFVCERRDGDLWARWEYRGFGEPEAVRDAPKHLRELGYHFEGVRGIAAGAVPRKFSGLVVDVLTDSRTLAVTLLGSQLCFGLFGLWLIRAEASKGQPLPALFPRNNARSLMAGVPAGLALFGLGSAYTFALRLFLGRPPPSPWEAAGPMPISTRVVFLVFGVLVAPVAEEIFFRGYIFGIFKSSNHITAGILVSAALFALAHFSDLYNVPAIFLYGMVLAWLYHQTGSLTSSMSAHAVNNGLAISALFVG